jgi:hypothetical protein
MVKSNIEYFHFVSDTRGDRYFKVDWINQKVTQVVLHAGEHKVGRPHMLGLYKLQMSSFSGTYYWYFGRKGDNTKLIYTTENQWRKAVDKITNILT